MPRLALVRISSRRDGSRGSAAVIATFLAVVVAGLAYGLLAEGMASRTGVVRTDDSMRALEIAETGLARAMNEISSLKDTGTDGIGVLKGAFGGGQYSIAWPVDGSGNTIPQPEAAYGNRWHLVATGSYGLAKRRIEVGIRRQSGGAYVEGLFSIKDLTVGGNIRTDAYDSRLGTTYQQQAVNSDSGGAYAQTGGSVGSNSGFITLSGSSLLVRGDAIPGPGRSVYENGNPIVTGDTTPRKVERIMPDPTFAEFQAALASASNPPGMSTSGKVNIKTPTTLPGGTYFFDQLTFTATGSLTFTGPTKIYVTGSLDAVGQSNANLLINATQLPSNLQIFAHPYDMSTGKTLLTPTSVKLAGGSNSAWTFYGPDATLDIRGNGDLFGAAVAQTISISGTPFYHYDKALDDLMPLGSGRLDRLYWREIRTPDR